MAVDDCEHYTEEDGDDEEGDADDEEEHNVNDHVGNCH